MRVKLSILLAAAVVAVVAVVATAGFGGSGQATEPLPAAHPAPAPAERASSAPAQDPPQLAALERREGVRIGVFALDTGSGRVVAHRADERFAFASTVKALIAGVALRRASDADLRRTVPIREQDVVRWSPIVEDHVGQGLSLQALISAMLQWSDNAAANLVVAQLGGRERFERELRRLGDRVTSLDRSEPDLNQATPGDRRDTTSPRAIAEDLRRFLLGDALPARRRDLLRRMMLLNATGDRTIRAGVPRSWDVADKTGTAGYGTRNDVAVVWPPDAAPIVIAVYTTTRDADAAPDDALVARATRIAVQALRR